MRYNFLRERERSYHGLLEAHFPALLERIAAEKPEALVFVDFTAISHAREPYWDALLSRELGKPHVKPPNKVELRGLAHLRKKMGEVAQKIISGRRAK